MRTLVLTNSILEFSLWFIRVGPSLLLGLDSPGQAASQVGIQFHPIASWLPLATLNSQLPRDPVLHTRGPWTCPQAQMGCH